MAENSQLSDETKNNSTDTSSTDASSAVIGNHENAVVPHKISNHDKLVQTMVMVDGEWINVNDTNDQANMKEDVHKVNKKVVEAQKGIVEAKNAADSAVKYADSAVSASKVNSDAIVAQSSAISEAKAAADDAASKAQFIKENASSEVAAIRNQVADVANNVSSVKADVASATSDVANLKVDVQANSAAIIKTNDAVKIQSKNSSDAINELKIANGQVESIAKDAKNNATVAKQTAGAATIVAQDAKSNAVVAKQTASSATIEATNATSTASKAELSVNGLTTRVDGIEGDAKKLSGRVTSTETILQQTKDQLLQKADKSVVDQANNLISQLSAEQKTMAGQISQKVSSAEYQTLRDKVNGIQVGTSNLLHDTSDQWRTLTNDSGWLQKTTASSCWTSTSDYHGGNEFTYAAKITNNSHQQAELEVWLFDQNKNWINGQSFYAPIPKGANAYDVNVTFPITTGTWYIRSWIIFTGGHAPHGDQIQVKDERLVRGNLAGTWEANPTDTITSIQKNITAIDENSKAIKLKADATEVNNLKGTVNSHSASINLFSDQLKSMVTESKVNDIINGKGFATQSTVQSLIDQKAGTINESITKLSNDTVTHFQSITASIDGLQSAVTNYQKDASSKYTQLSDLMQSKVNKGELESVRTQLASSINERIQKGNLITQFNLEAGRTLIQSNKIYFDADSFVMSPNSKAFIPSAYITNINADKITTGTLHSITINNGNGTFRVDPDGNVYANSMHVNHGSIYQGTVLGADVYSISNLTSNSLDKVNDATQNWVKLKDGTIELHGANGNHYSSIMPVDVSTSWNNDGSSDQQHGLGILDSQEIIIGQAALYSDDNNRITHSTNLSMINRTNLTISGSGIQATLAPGWGDSKGAYFTVQKDNKVGFYVGVGDNGNEVQIAGTGAIRLQGRRYIYDGFNDAVTHTLGSLQVDNLHVKKWLGVDSNKNAIVKTSQGTVAINAYETAEYYFGDIGEGQTDSNGVAYVGIEKLFNETVNTSIPYQVFITAYGPGNVWVEQRKQDRFMVKSSQPNIKFGWEIKAKRKGYEHTRLQNVDNKLNHMEATS